MAWHPTPPGWVLGSELRGQPDGDSCHVLALRRSRPGKAVCSGKDALTLGGPWCLQEAGRGLRAQAPVCDF